MSDEWTPEYKEFSTTKKHFEDYIEPIQARGCIDAQNGASGRFSEDIQSKLRQLRRGIDAENKRL